MPNRDALKEELLKTDDEYRRLYEEHQSYERRLEELNHKSLMSQEDEIEAKKIKLHKLTLKDRMAEIQRSHQQERLTA